MDNIEAPKSDLPCDSKTRTPAFAVFDANTDDLSHLLNFMARGTQNFVDEFKSSLEPKVTQLLAEITRLRENSGKTASDEVTPKEQIEAKAADVTTKKREVIQQLSNNVEPIKQFTSGFEMLRYHS